MKERNRVKELWDHPVYQKRYKRLQQLEGKRKFCRHDEEHFAKTAAIAMDVAKNNGLCLSSDVICMAALLHDMGRVQEIEQGISHAQASYDFAKEILGLMSYDTLATKKICEAIRCHSQRGDVIDRMDARETLETLSQILSFADQFSRNCYECDAAKECKWEMQQRIISPYQTDEVPLWQEEI